MGFGPFSSSSETSQRTNVFDQSATAADQGVVIANRRSGNSNFRLGRGASLTVNQGISTDQFNASLAALGSSLSSVIGASNAHTTGTANTSVDDALTQRVTDQVVNAPAEAQALGVGNWALIIGGGIALLFAVRMRRRNKT